MRRCTSRAPASRSSLTILRLVGPREIDHLEDALAGALPGQGLQRSQALVVHHRHLAGLDLADVLGLDEIERAGLAGEDGRAVAQPAQHQRPEAERIADRDDALL